MRNNGGRRREHLWRGQALAREQGFNPRLNIVTDGADGLEPLSLRIRDRPILCPGTGHVRAFVSAPHRDQHLRLSCEIVREFLRHSVRQIDSNLAHDRDHLGMHASRGLGSRGEAARSRTICQPIEPGGSHLGSARIVNAREEECLHALYFAVA
jgi:hypothetical protein